MRTVLLFLVLLIIIYSCLLQSYTIPLPQAATELAIQILQAVKGAHPGVAVGPHKRNSELINSLLGLPKFMIDAGRR